MKNNTLNKLQLVLAAVAMLLATILAFCPMISISLQPNIILGTQLAPVLEAAADKEASAAGANQAAVTKKYADIAAGFVDEEVEISHSGVSLIKSLPDTAKVVSAWITSVKLKNMQEHILHQTSDPNYSGSNAAVQDLLEKKELEEKLAGVDYKAVNEASIGNVRLCFAGLLEMASEGQLELGDGLGMQVLGVLFATLVKVVILAITLILFPIKMLVVIVKLIFALLSKREGVYSRVMGQCPIMLGWYGVVLANLAIWGGHFTVMGWLFTIAVVAVLAVNVIASRSKTYTSGERQFLNWMQLCAMISLVGAVLFAVCIAKADLIGFYVSAEASNQILMGMGKAKASGAPRLLVYLIAMCTSVVLVFVFRGVMGLLSRAACMNNPEKDVAVGQSLGVIVFGVILIIANAIVMGVFDLSLPAGQKGAFAVACVGILIALAGEVLLIVMRNVKMPDLTEQEVHAVMCGHSVKDVKQPDTSDMQASDESKEADA